MIEYKLLNRNNSPITLDSINNISASIECMYPIKEMQNVGSKIRRTYGVNGNTFHIYYGERSSDIGLPLNHEKEIKKTLKNVAQLKFGKK